MANFKLSHAGYGVLEAWAFCVIFCHSDAVGGVGSSFLLDFFVAYPDCLSSIAIGVGTVGALVLRACIARNLIQWYNAAMGVTLVSTALALFGSPLVSMAGFAVQGLSNAVLWIAWGIAYASLETTEGIESASLASAVVQILCILIVLSLPSWLRSALLLLLPVASAALFRMSVGGQSNWESAARKPEDGDSVREKVSGRFWLRFAAAFGIPCALTYFALAFVSPDFAMGDHIDLSLVVGLLVFLVLFVSFFQVAPGFGMDALFHGAVLLPELSLVSIGLGLPTYVSSALTMASIVFCQYLLWVYCVKIAKYRGGDVFLVIGVCQLVNHVSGGVVGLIAGLTVFSLVANGVVALYQMALLALAVSVVVGCLFVGKDDLLMREEAVVADRLEGEGDDRRDVIAHIADASRLTRREREIFELLAKGRSAPFIRDELVISLNTVNSHVRHIYGKLGIGTRQELFDLIEAEQQEASSAE